MALYAMSDLHLPLGIDKPMDIFGFSWDNYVERIHDNWINTVTDNDTVLMCGDFSWATYLEQSKADFEFLHSLPGKKILSKGNHDYWWSTAAKLLSFKEENGLDDIYFLNNNAFEYEDMAICGTRGWKSPFDKDFSSDDRKIYEREIIRLGLSIEQGKKISDKIAVMMHYPPDVGMNELLTENNVEFCVFGHLHGMAAQNYVCDENKVLVSADFLQFVPKRVY